MPFPRTRLTTCAIIAFLCASVFPSSAQDRPLTRELPPEQSTSSIRVHATIYLGNQGGTRLLTVVKKGQNAIRATIHDSLRKSRLVLIFNTDRMAILHEWAGDPQVLPLEGDEAATQLFDLVALTPNYHFLGDSTFDSETGVFEDFLLSLRKGPSTGVVRVGSLSDDVANRPDSLFLYRRADSIRLKRTIRYESFFEDALNAGQPKSITFVDEDTGDRGRIVIEEVEHNVGAADFLFVVPTVEPVSPPNQT